LRERLFYTTVSNLSSIEWQNGSVAKENPPSIRMAEWFNKHINLEDILIYGSN
jgi:hypothetical protein